jgi:hypothetical protein
VQSLKFFHNAFRGEALRFYEHSVIPVATIFAEAQELMTQHFSSRTRQNRAKEMLSKLKLEEFRRTKSLSTQQALEAVREQISILAPQCPREYNSDTHRSDSLAQAVRGESWATEVLRAHGAEPCTYQALYQRLESAIVFSDIAANSAYGVNYAKASDSQNRIPRQDYYGVPRTARPAPPAYQARASRDRACFNCGSLSHLLRNCPTRSNIKAGILQHLRQNRSPSEVLHVLADELSDALSPSSGSTDVDAQLEQILATAESDDAGQPTADDQALPIHFLPSSHDAFF